MTILLAGGGTAGHVEPALNVADALRELLPEQEILLLGTARGLETRLVPERGYELAVVDAVPLPRKLNGDLFALPKRIKRSTKQVRQLIEDRKVSVVVGFGGYVSTPAYLAARKRVPIVVHEANARAGIANKLGAQFTKYIALAVPGAISHGEVIGIPLRESIAILDRGAVRSEANEFWGLDPSRPCLLVFGGSQGSRRINDAVAQVVPDVVSAGGQVLHSVGLNNEDQIQSFESGVAQHYFPVTYIERMDLAYAAGDFAISRSGAMTCAELSSVGLPACFIPFGTGNGEQELNALPIVDAGGSVLLADKDVSADTLRPIVLGTLFDPDKLRKMSLASQNLGIRDAASKLARMILDAKEGIPSGVGKEVGGQ